MFYCPNPVACGQLKDKKSNALSSWREIVHGMEECFLSFSSLPSFIKFYITCLKGLTSTEAKRSALA